VLLWDLVRRKKLRSLKGHGGPVTALAVEPHFGKLYSASRDRTVRVWEAADRRCLRVLAGAADELLCLVALSPGRVAAGTATKQLLVWDVVQGAALLALVAHTGAVTAVAERDGLVASVSADRSLKLWDFRAGGGGGEPAPVLSVAGAHEAG